MRHPIRKADFKDDDRPNRIELGERLEPEVHEDSDASSELRDLGDDVLRREEEDEGRDREIHAAESQRHQADPDRERSSEACPQDHAQQRRETKAVDPAPEGVGPDAHENGMTEAHVPRQARDEVEGIGKADEEEKIDQLDLYNNREKRSRNAKDNHQEDESIQGRPEGGKSHPRDPHRRIPSRANRRTGMRTRKAAAMAMLAEMPNAGRTSIRIPRVSPPRRLPHIFPGPPRTTITKLMGA